MVLQKLRSNSNIYTMTDDISSLWAAILPSVITVAHTFPSLLGDEVVDVLLGTIPLFFSIQRSLIIFFASELLPNVKNREQSDVLQRAVKDLVAHSSNSY